MSWNKEQQKETCTVSTCNPRDNETRRPTVGQKKKSGANGIGKENGGEKEELGLNR